MNDTWFPDDYSLDPPLLDFLGEEKDGIPYAIEVLEAINRTLDPHGIDNIDQV